MSVTVNSCGTTNNCNFKGKWGKTEQGTPYYKTSSGTTAGAVLAIPAGLHWLKNMNFKEPSAEEIKLSKEMIKNSGMEDFIKKLSGGKNFDESLKMGTENSLRLKKYAIPFALTAAGLTLGCGMLIDKLRNNKAKEAANTIQQVGTKNAILNNDNIALSNKGRAYYESNQGSKYGALLGAGCGVVDAAMGTGKNLKTSGVILNVLICSLGGWIMGKIADNYTNKDARKHA